jgi:ActR/RegA family two-component response regulator
MFLGQWAIDALLTFPCNTHDPTTGAATDADSAPTYRLFEDETGTPILTGSMALLDASNTAGFYSEQITLSAANGFEVGKTYTVYITATVASVAGTMSHTFQVVSVASSAPTAAAIRTEIDSNSTMLAAIAGYIDTEVAAIKAKTDNLPAAPAAVGDIPTAIQNADALLKRDMSAVTGEAARSPLNALRWLRNKWAISGSTLSVKKEDDTTEAWAGTVTQTAGNPTTGIDPS